MNSTSHLNFREVIPFTKLPAIPFRFRHSLMTWGEKFTANEIDDAFNEFQIEGGMIDAAHIKSLMVAKKDEEA